MNKVILCGHTGSINRGCEAIVRSTSKIINKIMPNYEVWLSTFTKNDDVAIGLNNVFDKIIEYNNIKRYSIDHFMYFLFNRLLKDDYSAQKIIQKPVWRNIDENSLCLNVGGDTYCYNKPISAYNLNEYCRKSRVKSVFWGCSVEKNKINKEMINDLNKYSLILVRESITYDNIMNVIFDKNKVKLCADPAFVLDSEKIELPKCFESNVIGLNLSPIVMESGKSGIALKNYDILIKYILDNTNDFIALIPHVYDSNNLQDLIPHRYLYNKYKQTNRVINFDMSYNCMQLKYIISKCNMFIGARTHATIAAYSTCVPTLVVGYSVKSKGIAKDLFGTYENYVVPVQNLENSDDLLNSFKWLMNNKVIIKNHLNSVMPSYIRKSWHAGEEIKRLIEG